MTAGGTVNVLCTEHATVSISLDGGASKEGGECSGRALKSGTNSLRYETLER